MPPPPHLGWLGCVTASATHHYTHPPPPPNKQTRITRDTLCWVPEMTFLCDALPPLEGDYCMDRPWGPSQLRWMKWPSLPVLRRGCAVVIWSQGPWPRLKPRQPVTPGGPLCASRPARQLWSGSLQGLRSWRGVGRHPTPPICPWLLSLGPGMKREALIPLEGYSAHIPAYSKAAGW